MKKVNGDFNKQSLTALRNELDAVLAKYEKKINVKLETGSIKFSGSEATIKIEAKVVGGVTKNQQALIFTKFKFGDVIRDAKLGELKMIGFNTRAKKYPYEVKAINGKEYKLSETQVNARIAIV
jgi:glycerophosphoryl diester phosphodiesterase